ncbi:SIR2 family protein, partial [bacterium]|nr:SIR2 family protein [bacterium]
MTGSKNPRIAEISDIVQWIKYHCNHEPDKRKPGLTFLIGAGFSASAGIPTAGPMIENSLRKHELLKNVGPIPKDKSEYTYLMSQLPPVERIKVVRAAIQGAEDEATGRLKINWAHLLMATLVDAGYINQILTTNFDPLMVEALSIIGQPVRVFDLSAGSGFQADALQKGSIIYLHGQSHSMWICNAQEELDRVRPHLNAVFQDALRDSIFIIVGYSGNCDPVLQELIDRFPVFSHRLYWVHHDPTTNPGELAMQLLTDYSREAFLVKDLDADAFMRELVLQGLELELPLIVKNPLDSLTRNLARIMPFPKKEGEPTPDDPVDGARNLVMKANDMVKSQSKGDLAWSNELISIAISMAAMTYSRSKIEELRTKVEPLHNKELNQQLGDAYILLASKSLDHEQIEQAIEDLRVAENLGVQEQHWLHTTWGNALSAQARTKDGAEADSLFNQSYEKYTEAIRIKREMHEAWNNWGIALSAQARTKDGAEADPLFKQSY